MSGRPSAASRSELVRLLLVEDDEAIGGVLTASLAAAGREVVWRRAGREALREAQKTAFDLILLDPGLPDADGIEVCRRLRAAHPSAVIVIVSSRADEPDVVTGLESGADDYLTKPIRLGELMARVRAHLRRVQPRRTARGSLQVGDLVGDTATRRVKVRAHELALPTREFDLLVRLLATPDVAIPRGVLLSEAWGADPTISTRALDAHVAALRRNLHLLRDVGAVPRIVTVWGHGYRLESPS